MKNKLFPYNCINLVLRNNELDENIGKYINFSNLKQLLIKGETENSEEFNLKLKKIKIELFYFLHDLFLDQIFLGNEIIFITENDILWNSENEKFYLNCKFIFFKF